MLRVVNGGLLGEIRQTIGYLLEDVEVDRARENCKVENWTDAELHGIASKGNFMNYKKLVRDSIKIKEVKAGGSRKEKYYIQIPSYMSPTGKLRTKYSNSKEELEKYALATVMEWYKSQQESKTIGGLWESALKHKVKAHKNASKTEKDNRSAYKLYIASQPIESMVVTDVNKYVVLNQWLLDTCERLRNDGYTITSKFISNAKTVMNIILNYAVAQGLIETNVLRNAEFTDLRYQIDKTAEKEESWTRAELEAIKEQVKIDNAKLFNTSNHAIMTAIYTGCRVGEVVALKWSDLDFVKECIHVQRMESRSAKNERVVVPWTKCNAHTEGGDRFVPFPKELQECLLELKDTYKKLDISSAEDYIFIGLDGERKNTNMVDKRNRNAQEHLHIENKKGMHAYRKTFATLYMQDGGNGIDLQMILGHSSFNTTSNHYIKAQKTDMGRIKRANSMLNRDYHSENEQKIVHLRA